jgi:hypothetical protein
MGLKTCSGFKGHRASIALSVERCVHLIHMLRQFIIILEIRGAELASHLHAAREV